MTKAQPIRSREDVDRMKDYLLNESSRFPALRQRNYMIFLLGINTGLRIGDILDLKVKDVTAWRIQHVDRKTGKMTDRKMNRSVKTAMRAYIKDRDRDEYLFLSHKTKGKMKDNSYWPIIKEAANFLGLEDIATHSMRKTFGYIIYTEQGDKKIADIMDLLNHSKESTTLRYLGVTRDTNDKTVDKVNL